jgi:hypothetical protein
MSYYVKIIMSLINMELCQNVLVQQVINQIGNIQNKDSFECTLQIFDIVILGYKHIFPVHYILKSNI